MGNRAVIQFGLSEHAVGIYLHWNGGIESVRAFLDAARERKVSGDGCYQVARLAQIIGNFFGGTQSLGVATVDRLDCDNGDNGTFIVVGWHIVGVKHRPQIEETVFDWAYYAEVLKNVLEANPVEAQS